MTFKNALKGKKCVCVVNERQVECKICGHKGFEGVCNDVNQFTGDKLFILKCESCGSMHKITGPEEGKKEFGEATPEEVFLCMDCSPTLQ